MLLKKLLLSEIIPYPDNPRVNNHAVTAVAESIKQFGYVQPILVDSDNVIIAGHTRHKALLLLYGAENASETEVEVVDGSHLTEEQVKALRIADNKVGELSEWDFNLLSAEITDLVDTYDFTDLGFTKKELSLLLGEEVVKEESNEEPTVPIKIGKDTFTFFQKDFDAWSAEFQESNGMSFSDYILNINNLHTLARRYALSRK